MSLIDSWTPFRVASANISATKPVTACAAMLVPDFRTTPVPVRECAAITNPPGAEISGFSRPSRVGPEEEKLEIGNDVLCAS